MAKRDRLHIILDCNWYISGSINRKSRRTIYSIINNPRLTVIYSDELLEEYNTVISRTKFQAIISKYQANRFIQFLLPRLQKVKITSAVNINRDAKDNYLLALANAGRADFLVTGDEDLLVLKKFNKTRIIKLTEFEKLITE